MVLVDTDFLETLPDSEYRSGYAEMLKHGLIQEPAYFEALSGFLDKEAILPHIHHSVGVKAKVVSEDIDEQGLRKILNFGHTLGHAVESHFLTAQNKTRLLHGEAIAIGMILEAFLSVKVSGLSLDEARKIKRVFNGIYPKVSFDNETITEVIKMLTHDKKNEDGNVLFVLLKSIGEPVWNQSASEELILEAFDFYKN
jgi:3-dehydroquinate synthase